MMVLSSCVLWYGCYAKVYYGMECLGVLVLHPLHGVVFAKFLPGIIGRGLTKPLIIGTRG